MVTGPSENAPFSHDGNFTTPAPEGLDEEFLEEIQDRVRVLIELRKEGKQDEMEELHQENLLDYEDVDEFKLYYSSLYADVFAVGNQKEPAIV